LSRVGAHEKVAEIVPQMPYGKVRALSFFYNRKSISISLIDSSGADIK
jgi:hypothetical protein